MNSQTLRATWPLAKIVVASAFALSFGMGLVATGAARPAVPTVQSSISPGVTGMAVSPNPWCLSDPELPVLTVTGQGRFSADHSSTSFGNWATKSGKFNSAPYNRTRTKTVVDVVYYDQYVRIGSGTGGAPARFFYGTGPYIYQEPFTPDPGTGPMTGWMNTYVQESNTTTTTAYTEYWYKSGNKWTYVGTGPGTVVSSVRGGGGQGGPAYFSYEVVDCATKR